MKTTIEMASDARIERSPFGAPAWTVQTWTFSIDELDRFASLVRADERQAIEQAEQVQPVAWRNAALRVGEDLCSVGPFGYYDMTAEQWLDWALSVVTVHAPPPPRQPLTDAVINAAREALDASFEAGNDEMDISIPAHLAAALSMRLDEYDAAHGIKENT